ncbi:MAG: hypothetical protein ABTQ73_13085 [Caldilineales bacterium]
MRLLFRLLLALLVLLLSTVLPAVAQTPAPPQGRTGQPIIIRWSTETEVNTAGFNVYRALSEDGPWQQINTRLIPGSPDPVLGGSYVFTDTNVTVGVTYWYELEEIELSGQATRLERTSATAQGGLFGGLQCLGVPLAGALGMAAFFITRRARWHGSA